MKIKNALPKLMAIFSAIVLMASCEEDLGTIGSQIIGDQNVDAILDDTKTVLSYSRKLVPTQSNELPIYQLGSYTDPAYGRSTVNLLSQLTLNNTNPNFNFYPELDSVVLYIPYFSELTTDDEGVGTYELDSVYGNSPINIEIFESGYFLRDFDPSSGFEETQKYYTNQGPLFNSFQGELIHTITNFVPSSDAIETVEFPDEDDDGGETEPVVTELPPGLRDTLPTAYWEEKIFSREDTPDLLNNNNFREYLRGLYFKVNGSGDNLIKFDLSDARIDIHYTFQTDSNIPSDDIPRTATVLTLGFDAINVNVFDNDLTPSIAADLENPDVVNGEEHLYVHGGDGVITLLELFGDDADGNGVADELDQMRQDEWLINEANLIFYVDKGQVSGGSQEPERIVIYDIENGTALIDYTEDTTSGDEAIDAYTTHLGRLQRDSDGKGDFYKIRITNYLSDLIHKDSTNVALGLVVSQNVGAGGYQDLETTQAPGVEQVPSSSVVAHEGTVLFGNNSTNTERKLKLQIYYTEPN
ncbi:DUF4270 domain-containing protein [Patiriisocius marinus]|nr:DUF4270 domain-containing protein [Patiriisocius marinus]